MLPETGQSRHSIPPRQEAGTGGWGVVWGSLPRSEEGHRPHWGRPLGPRT